MLTKGTRVKTADGYGIIEYVRMAPPRFDSVLSVSVILDAKKGKPGYRGSAYLASDVSAEETP